MFTGNNSDHPSLNDGDPGCWYALRVRVKAESRSVLSLQDRGFHPYCPTHSETQVYSDRLKVKAIPVFPGYLFCQFRLSDRTNILSSVGVEYVVAFGGVPARIPEHEISDLRRVVAGGAWPIPYLSRGQTVEVTRGPFKGATGILTRDGKGDMLVISITALNRSVAVHIDRAHVAPITQPPITQPPIIQPMSPKNAAPLTSVSSRIAV